MLMLNKDLKFGANNDDSVSEVNQEQNYNYPEYDDYYAQYYYADEPVSTTITASTSVAKNMN